MFIRKISEQFKSLFLVLGLTLFLLITGHYAIGVARYVKHKVKGVHTGQALVNDLKNSPVFAGYAGYDQYFNESALDKMQVKPYYHWRRAPFDGKEITIDKYSVRKTIKSPSPDAKKVFMFGGSTMWGTGSPNQYTIPSYLQNMLGDKYDVYNFGETAFVSAQELNLLLETLSNGFIPDIVIFYDGVNDIYASLYSPAIPRDPQFRPEDYTSKESLSYLVTKLVNKTNYIALTERIKMITRSDTLSKWEDNVSVDFDSHIDSTIEQYKHLIKQVKALGDAYGFKTYHFWQPVIFTDEKSLDETEKKILSSQSPMMVNVYQKAYQKFKEQSNEVGFYYIADAFKNESQPIYFDFCHVGPKGNELVAKRIFEHIQLG